jgi:hypothetical protein
MLLTTEVDTMYWRRLIAHLEHVKDFDAFASTEADQKGELTAARNEILAQIDGCERAMKKLSKRLIQLTLEEKDEQVQTEHSSDDEGTEESDLVKDIRKEHKRYSAEKKRQEERLRLLDEEKPSYASLMLTYRELILEVRERISEYTTIEERQEIAQIFATTVTLDTLSPRVYKMNIYWRDTTWGIEEIVAVREGNPSTWWNVDNDTLLREHYPTATRKELMELFPDRPVSAIYRRASTLRLKKTKEDRDSGKLDIAEDLSLKDYAVMEKYGLCWTRKQEDTPLKYPGGDNGGEHGVSLDCCSGQSGLFTVNGVVYSVLVREAITTYSQILTC